MHIDGKQADMFSDASLEYSVNRTAGLGCQIR